MHDRHRRIHEPRADGEIGGYSDDDLENEEQEFGEMNEDSPPQENNYLPAGLSNVAGMGPNGNGSMTMPIGRPISGPGMPMAAPSQLIQAQQHMLQGQM